MLFEQFICLKRSRNQKLFFAGHTRYYRMTLITGHCHCKNRPIVIPKSKCLPLLHHVSNFRTLRIADITSFNAHRYRCGQSGPWGEGFDWLNVLTDVFLFVKCLFRIGAQCCDTPLRFQACFFQSTFIERDTLADHLAYFWGRMKSVWAQILTVFRPRYQLWYKGKRHVNNTNFTFKGPEMNSHGHHTFSSLCRAYARIVGKITFEDSDL